MAAITHTRVDLATARTIARLCYPDRQAPSGASYPAQEGPLARPDEAASAHLVSACVRNKVPLLSLPATHELYGPLLFQDDELSRAPATPITLDEPSAMAASLAPGALLASVSYRRAIEEERRDWVNTRREYLSVQQAWEHEGIRAVLIKSAGIAPSLPYRSDNLDVLIDPQHDRLARRILFDLGYVEITNVEEPLKFLFRKFHLGESISAIHLHEAVGWGTGFMNDATVLADARPAPDDTAILIPSPEDALLINMAHAFYEDKEIKLGDLWKIIHLLRTNRLDWDHIERQAAGRGWADGLDVCVLLWSSLEEQLYAEHSFPAQVVDHARKRVPASSFRYVRERLASEPSFPFALSFRFSKKLYYAKALRDPALTSRQKSIDIIRHTLAGFKRRLPFTTQPAMLVTLSGIDGSGKTVHAQALCSAFQQCEIDARVVWMRGGSSPFADRVIGLVKPWLVRGSQHEGTRSRTADSSGSSAANAARAEGHAPTDHGDRDIDFVGDTRQAKVSRKHAWLRRPSLRTGWISLVTADLLLTCLRRVWWPLARGRVIICDRYIYDALVEIASLANRERILGGWAARLLRALCPRPKQAYLLDAEPENAIQRKPDELVSFIREQALLYRSVASDWQMCVLDTNDSQEASTDHLVHRVLREYYRDWHTCIAALFWANPLRHHVDS